jgi:hypothetical protein
LIDWLETGHSFEGGACTYGVRVFDSGLSRTFPLDTSACIDEDSRWAHPLTIEFIPGNLEEFLESLIEFVLALGMERFVVHP